MRNKRNFIFFLVVAISFAFCASANARNIEQGTFEVSGMSNLGLSTNDYDYASGSDYETDNFTLDVGGTFYVIKNLGIGLRFGYESTSGGTNTMLGIGPLVAYDISLNQQWSLYFQGEFGLMRIKSEQEGLQDVTIDGFYLKFGGGATVFVTESVAVNLGLSYLSAELEGDLNNTDVDGLNSGVQISVFF